MQTPYLQDQNYSPSSSSLEKIKRETSYTPEQLLKIVSDKKILLETIIFLNERAVKLMLTQKSQAAVFYLEVGETILEEAASHGKIIDRSLVILVLHNQACCHQDMWFLDKCSNYIEALIYNINSQLRSGASSPIDRDLTANSMIFNKSLLSGYYLQFCAINSQLKNHSGALISSRKSIETVKEIFGDMKDYLLLNKKQKQLSSNWKERLRTAYNLSHLNVNLDMKQHDTLIEAVRYYLNIWKSNLQQANATPQIQQMLEAYTIATVMQIKPKPNQQMALRNQASLLSSKSVLETVLVMSIGYFTIATELRLLYLQRNRDKGVDIDKWESSQFRESEVYHLMAIIILAIFVSPNSQIMRHLLKSYTNHYNCDLIENGSDVEFKKSYMSCIFSKQMNQKSSLLQFQMESECSLHLTENEDEFYISNIEKPVSSNRNYHRSKSTHKEFKVPSTKGPKKKHLKLKTKSKSKIKTEIKTGSALSLKKNQPRVSTSKSPQAKHSVLMKSPTSKESIGQAIKSPKNALKHINSTKHKTKTEKQHLNRNINKNSEYILLKGRSKEKKKEEYFVHKALDQKKKKSSSSKKSHSKSSKREGNTLADGQNFPPKIGSSKELKEKEKNMMGKDLNRKSILQHYL